MRLLYCYTEFLDKNGNPRRFRGLDTIEVNLSATDVFSYDKNTNTLSRTARKHPLPENFWTSGSGNTNIYNVNVIAGQNGSGKTTVMNYIIDLLNYVYHGIGTELNDSDRRIRYDPSGNHNILVFSDDEEMLLLDLVPNIKLTTVQHVSAKGFTVQPQIIYRRAGERFAVNYQRLKDSIAKTKVIYMTNTLNQRDYELELVRRTERRRDPFVYDCTIGAAIGNDISSFFLLEVFKQVKFVFDPRFSALYDLPDSVLRIPKALSIRLRLDRYREYFQRLRDVSSQSVVELLCELCVAAYPENLGILNENTINSKQSFWSGDFTTDNFMSQISEITEVYLESIVSGSDDCTLRVWNFMNGKCFRTINGHTDSVYCVEVTDDGRCVSGSSDNTLRVWDLNTGECLRTMEGHTNWIRSVAMTANGRCISGAGDNTLRVWDLNTGECLRTIEGHTSVVTCVVVIGDSRCISGAGDHTLRVWDLNTGECLRTMEGHTDWVNCVEVTGDGRCISGSSDNTMRMCDLNTGECLRTMEGHCPPISSVTVTGDGRCISGSWDNTLRVWDLNTGKCLKTMDEHSDWVRSVAVTRDGRCISGSDDGTHC